MNGAFHSKRDVDMFYVSREDGKPGKMLKVSTEGGQQNKFILTS